MSFLLQKRICAYRIVFLHSDAFVFFLTCYFYVLRESYNQVPVQQCIGSLGFEFMCVCNSVVSCLLSDCFVQFFVCFMSNGKMDFLFLCIIKKCIFLGLSILITWRNFPWTAEFRVMSSNSDEPTVFLDFMHALESGFRLL